MSIYAEQFHTDHTMDPNDKWRTKRESWTGRGDVRGARARRRQKLRAFATATKTSTKDRLEALFGEGGRMEGLGKAVDFTIMPASGSHTSSTLKMERTAVQPDLGKDPRTRRGKPVELDSDDDEYRLEVTLPGHGCDVEVTDLATGERLDLEPEVDPTDDDAESHAMDEDKPRELLFKFYVLDLTSNQRFDHGLDPARGAIVREKRVFAGAFTLSFTTRDKWSIEKVDLEDAAASSTEASRAAQLEQRRLERKSERACRR